MSIYLILFLEFFKIGLFAIGGGLVTLPFLMDLSEKYDWYSMADLSNMIAVSESTPGPIGLNMATYAGFQAGGVLGGFVATMGLVMPSIIIVSIVAKFLANFRDNHIVQSVFMGIRPAVTGLIAIAILEMFKISLFVEKVPELGTTLSVKTAILAVILFVLMSWKKVKNLHPVVWILFAAVIGIIFKF